MKNFSIAVLLVAVGCVASCATPFGEAPGPDSGSDQTNGDLDGGVVDPGATFSFVQADGPVYVRQGQPINLPITVKRSITPGTDIKINITGAIQGLSVGSLTIPSGSSTGSLPITVDASTPQGLTHMSLHGSAEGASANVVTDLQLFVRGQPGALDTTFHIAPDGIIEDTIDYSYIYTATPQSDGTILITAQNPAPASSPSSAVIRLNADGLVDKTLTGTKIQNITGYLFDAFGAGASVAAYSDGRILTAGSTINRYMAVGDLDTTFNETNPWVTNSSPPIIPADWPYFQPEAVAVGQDDSIYVGGYTDDHIPNYPYAFLQIPANGQPADGQMMHGCSGSYNNTDYWQYITHLSLLPTGALAFAGVSVEGPSSNRGGLGVGRYKQPSSCTLDEKYGPNGNGTWSSPDWSYLGDAFFETDGSVDLLVDKGTNPPYVYSIVHLDPAGNPAAPVDSPLVCYNENTLSTYGCSITRAPDGRYLVAGQYQDPTAGSDSMAVAYYTSDLQPDTSIGNQDGIVTIPVSTALTDHYVYAMRAVYTPDGLRTVVVGSISGGNAAGADVVRIIVARIWN
ncbi:MAG: hypothetical protein FWD73_10675 [Polyangiaceae bacterium]|nr:hypothetical protein [Polyangiaceae bacterium]